MLSTITRMIRTNAAVHAVDEGLARHARGDVGVVGEHRRRRHARVERVQVHAGGDSHRDEQRCCFADHPRDRQGDPGGDAGDRRRDDDLRDRAPLRHAEGVRASRSSFGTILSISSVERTTTGIMSTDSATEPMKPIRMPGPANSANSAKANRPATIDGMPVMTSTKKVIARGSRPRPYSTRYGGHQPDRDRHDPRERSNDHCPDDGVVRTAALADDSRIGT